MDHQIPQMDHPLMRMIIEDGDIREAGETEEVQVMVMMKGDHLEDPQDQDPQDHQALEMVSLEEDQEDLEDLLDLEDCQEEMEHLDH